MSENAAYAFDAGILRAYDIRGEWQKTLRPQDAFALGCTLAERWGEGQQKGFERQILVARDGRESSPALSLALQAGLQHGGAVGIDLGILPTPALYFAEACRGRPPRAAGGTQAEERAGAVAGVVVGAVMVTGSHNPPQHNGFKLVCAGKPFFGQDLQNLAASLASAPRLSASLLSSSTVPNEETSHGRAWREAYVERLLEEDARVRGGRISSVWDMGGGAGSVVAKDLVPRLAGEHRLLSAELDPSFAARSPDPGKAHALDGLREQVVASGAEVGLAFDGDADRLVVLTSEGRRLSGDRLLLLFAADLLQNGERGGRSAPLVLCDIKTSPCVLRAIERLGGRAELVQTGHAHVKRALADKNASMAGEVSGHLFFNDRYGGYDDALYAAVRLCGMVRSGFAIERALTLLPPSVSSDELRLPIREDRKFALVEKIREEIRENLATRTGKDAYGLCTLDGVRVEREDGGWWLLRASNTEEAMVLRAEAGGEGACRKLLAEIGQLLQRHGYETERPLSEATLVDC